jgi:ABC-type uncharacterized transport system substrate-binding protein
VQAAIGQQARIPRIGVLYFTRPTDAFYQTRVGLFRQRLAELGCVEGKTIIIEERFADGSDARLNELAREMVASKVDIIVMQAVTATVAAHKTAKTISGVVCGEITQCATHPVYPDTSAVGPETRVGPRLFFLWQQQR